MANKNTFENLQDIFIFLKNVFKKNLMNQNQNHSHFFLQLIANRNSLYQC